MSICERICIYRYYNLNSYNKIALGIESLQGNGFLYIKNKYV